ncbi:hypothetical protein TWF730_006322 [Orbilia blumenaviensis]|uniref:Nucleoside phosphorylase domain-containing protein n=1 Tax=Orbilia blumenaviensis TaxID=1796055 RepID=A0AAV9VGZ1_9PEZI
MPSYPQPRGSPVIDRTDCLPKDYYTVLIVCPLDVEQDAVFEHLDERHPSHPWTPWQQDLYTLGRIGNHNVVIVSLASVGTNAAAVVATAAWAMFRSLRFTLLVGIGGGIPQPEGKPAINIGDVVIGDKIRQWDFGKVLPEGGFQATGHLNKPPRAMVQAAKRASSKPIAPQIAAMIKAQPPEGIQKSLVVHRGTIASGNAVIKNKSMRDFIRNQTNALCIDMEAAGLADDHSCLTIRGISDRADPAKTDLWHRYAAAAAAAVAKFVLGMIEITEEEAARRAQEVNTTATENRPPYQSVQSPGADISSNRRPSNHTTDSYGTQQNFELGSNLGTLPYTNVYSDLTNNTQNEGCSNNNDLPEDLSKAKLIALINEKLEQSRSHVETAYKCKILRDRFNEMTKAKLTAKEAMTQAQQDKLEIPKVLLGFAQLRYAQATFNLLRMIAEDGRTEQKKDISRRLKSCRMTLDSGHRLIQGYNKQMHAETRFQGFSAMADTLRVAFASEKWVKKYT